MTGYTEVSSSSLFVYYSTLQDNLPLMTLELSSGKPCMTVGEFSSDGSFSSLEIPMGTGCKLDPQTNQY